MKIGGNPRKLLSWIDMVEKIRKKLSKWKGKTLSLCREGIQSGAHSSTYLFLRRVRDCLFVRKVLSLVTLSPKYKGTFFRDKDQKVGS